MGLIVSNPQNGPRASGTVTEPSLFWKFSKIAIRILGDAITVLFRAYANFFFYADGTRRDPDNPPLSRQVAAFDRAWVHHANWNDHHWNYWAEAPHNSVNRDVREAVIMSIPAMKEMVADMIGASRAQGNENYEKSASEFYFKHLKSGRIVLHPVTETFVSTEFGILARRVINDNS